MTNIASIIPFPQVFEPVVARVRSDFVRLVTHLRTQISEVCKVTVTTGDGGGLELHGRPQDLVTAETYIILTLEAGETRKTEVATTASKRQPKRNSKSASQRRTPSVVSGYTSPSVATTSVVSSVGRQSQANVNSWEQQSYSMTRQPDTLHPKISEKLDVDADILRYIVKLNNDCLQDIKAECSVRIRKVQDGHESGIATLTITGRDGVSPAMEKLRQLISYHELTLGSEKCPIREAWSTEAIDKTLQQVESDKPDYLLQYTRNHVSILGPRKGLRHVKCELQDALRRVNSNDSTLSSRRKPQPNPRSVSGNVRNSTEVDISFETIASFETNMKRRIHLYRGDITKLPADAIVNAANDRLEHGGGIAKAISTASGPHLQTHSRERVRSEGRIPVSQCMVTPSYNLPSKCIIHVVGPKWAEFRPSEKRQCVYQLRDAFSNCLATADTYQCRSVVIPAVSSGKLKLSSVLNTKTSQTGETILFTRNYYCR